MSDIISNIGYMIGYVWGLMANDFLPGLSFRVVFIFTWVLAICIELLVNLGLSWFMGEGDYY